MAKQVNNASAWAQVCGVLYGNSTTDLVDQFGKPTTNRSDAWGITAGACYKFCGPNMLSQVFDFGTFAPAFTNFFLPWLALTAQLPYETSEWWSDLLCLCLALGSPALITFSLCVTILNRHWIKHQFEQLHREVESVGGLQRNFAYKLRGAQILLQEGQQAPLRVSTADGSLNDLLLVEQNSRWWRHVGKDLIKTRRGVTSSLVAQIVLAAISWLVTVIISFGSDLGDIETALQLASGSMLIWMIPVICGWIVVGTQRRYNSVKDTLEDIDYSITRTNLEGEWVQQGLLVKTGLNDAPENPMTLGLDITGDEGRQGPIFNFSRILTWSRASSTLIEGLRRTASHQATCHRNALYQSSPLMYSETQNEKSPNTHTQPVGYQNSPKPFTDAINAYPSFSEVESGVWWRLIVAALLALFMQWGTTGPALMIAYLTPAVGLGCRSGSYLIYGVIGTIVWAFHCISALLSHTAMLLYQDMEQRVPPGYHEPITNQPEPSRYHRMICWLAVLTDILGKSLAVANASWIVISNLFEYMGFYSTCWCQSDSIGLGRAGWVVLFVTASDIANVAGDAWRGGVALGVFVCLASTLFFALSCREERRSLSRLEW